MIYNIETKKKRCELRLGDLCEVKYIFSETELDDGTKVNCIYTVVGYFYRIIKTRGINSDTLVLVNELSDGHFKESYCTYEDEMPILIKEIRDIKILK